MISSPALINLGVSDDKFSLDKAASTISAIFPIIIDNIENIPLYIKQRIRIKLIKWIIIYKVFLINEKGLK